MKDINEIWRDIPGFEGKYQASNLGNIKSLNYRRTNKAKELKLFKGTGHGYLQVQLSNDKSRIIRTVHQLVAMTFLEHIPDGSKIVVDHINGDRYNNTLKNLRIISQRENTSLGYDKKKTLSKYRGVTYQTNRNKWTAMIWINGKLKHLRRFNFELDAHIAYEKRLKEYENSGK